MKLNKVSALIDNDDLLMQLPQKLSIQNAPLVVREGVMPHPGIYVGWPLTGSDYI